MSTTEAKKEEHSGANEFSRHGDEVSTHSPGENAILFAPAVLIALDWSWVVLRRLTPLMVEEFLHANVKTSKVGGCGEGFERIAEACSASGMVAYILCGQWMSSFGEAIDTVCDIMIHQDLV